MKKINNQELISFCSQLAMILKAGISVAEGLVIMKEDLPEGEGRDLLESLYEKEESSGHLCEAMRETGVFPAYVCDMTQIGEQTGRLDEVMEGLAAHYEREEELSSSIRSALLYPAVMLGMMTIVVLVLVIYVMPVFDRVFEQLGGGLTGVSAGVMRLGETLSRYGLVFLVLLIVLVLLICYLALTEKGKERLHRFLEKSRWTREISRKMACARVADGLNLCIRSGLDLDQSLEMTQQLAGHTEMKQRLQACREKLLDGVGFDHALTETGIFSGVYGKMVSVGIRTGSVDQVMEKIAGEYEDSVTDRLYRTVSVIEPTMVAVLSVLVGLILLSVMLPLMNIMANLG